MRLIDSVLRRAFDRRLESLYRRATDPGPVQDRLLARLVRRARETEWGRAHDYAGIRSVADFQARVPLTTFEEAQPFWQRAEAGACDVTWPGRTRYFAVSAGTTSGSKHVPLTADAIRSQRHAGGHVVALSFRQMGRTDFTSARFLYLGGTTRLRVSEVYQSASSPGRRFGGPSVVGDASGIMSAHVPALARRYRLPGPDVAAIENWEARVEGICQQYLNAPVTVVAGLPSWVVPLFERLIAVGRERIGRRVKTVADVWPRLGAVVSFGMALEPYLSSFQYLVGRDVCYINTYSSSEGGMNAVQDQQVGNPQDQASLPGMLLLPDTGVFYEFVRLDEAEHPNARRRTLREVEMDVPYELVISSNAGVWAYRLGDVVRFVSLHPHRLVMAGRTHHRLSAFGEHVIGEELEAGIIAGCRATGGEVTNFTVQAVFPQPVAGGGAEGEAGSDRRGRHRWYVEFRRPPADAEAFVSALDQRLIALNVDYAAYRGGDVAVGPPDLVALAQGTFYEWMKRAGRLGGQFKIPRVLTDDAEARRLEAISDELSAGAAARGRSSAISGDREHADR